jgi:uncharacterized protein YjbI with pentapeptide repeats
VTELRADCTRCFALCCVVPAFAASADFAIDKAAGHPCPNLRTDQRCGIHAELRPRGFAGCVAYDCFGAGQRVSQVTIGRDWRADRATARLTEAVFPAVRQLHELLWYLTGALAEPAAAPLHAELRRSLAATERLAAGDPAALVALDLGAHGRSVDALLCRASALVRTPPDADRRGADPVGRDLRGADLRGADLVGRDLRAADLRGADLLGRDLRGADLRAADLRGALLIAADLRGADLRLADLIAADLRAADLGGADLTGSLFVTQPQLTAARGDAATRLPAVLRRPAHWSRTVEA